jgi:hypothetical protein
VVARLRDPARLPGVARSGDQDTTGPCRRAQRGCDRGPRLIIGALAGVGAGVLAERRSS